MATTLEFRMSDFVEKFFYLNNAPFNLDDYPHMRLIYNIDPPEMVFNTSRQVAKSTTLAMLGSGRMMIMPQTRREFAGGFKVLYIAPTVEQVKLFSHDRVTPVIEQTPFIKKHFLNSSQIQNVFLKRFTNGSSMYFRYAAASPDKARGISCDMLIADEVQDIPRDHITIIQQSMARSMYKRTIYAGTPKRTIGTLAEKWDSSTKNEWYVKCMGCNKYNYLDEANIHEWGLGCRYCHTPIDARNGMWIRTNSASVKGDNKSATPGKYLCEGFRISVLMFAHSPWVDWQKDVWIPYITKPRGIFLNEYLGLAYDAGVAPITLQDIQACCTGGPMRDAPDNYIMSYPRFMGMDWGPINSANSKTVQSVLIRRGEMVEVVYMKKYIGRESDYSYLHGEIPAQFARWKCEFLGADAGFGEAVNSEIRKRMLDPKRLIALQHLGNQKQKANWNQNMMAYTLGRNRVMTDMFHKIKNRQIVFPRWEDFAPFADDLLAIQIDYDEEKNKYKYINSRADDAFHSILYGDFVSELWYKTQGA